MAKNRLYSPGQAISVPVPVGTLSGDPVVLGQLPGFAVKDRDTAGESTVEFEGVFTTPVKGVTNGAVNAAVAAGDILYYTGGATPKLNKDTTGIRFGYAMAAVVSGATTTIAVKVGY
jgi:predicted RecA/RadA family phage recombinase